MDTKTRPIHICCLQEIHFRSKNTNRLKMREWKKIFHTNENEKEAAVAKLISDKITLKNKHSNKRQRKALHN